jgi:tRNA threonylcarbamoyladenosine biosynthesis protein TsaB
MAVILILETSTDVCSVALMKDGHIIDIIESKDGQNHARLVTVFADSLMERNNIKPIDLVAVAVSKGPGSYTGLRIGISTAKGICYASRIPLIGIGTLEAMSDYVMSSRIKYSISEDKPCIYCPMIDARRMEVYTMLLDENGNVLKAVTAEIIDETFYADESKEKQLVIFGNGSAKCIPILKLTNAIFVDGIEASAQHMEKLVWHAYINKRFENVAYFEPFYLKDFVATVSKKNMLE